MNSTIRDKAKACAGFSEKGKKAAFRRAGLRMLTVLLMMALIFSLGGCAAVETPSEKELPAASGADAFKRYYTQKAANDTEHDYSRMCLEELEEMASENVGTAVDTEELTIEVTGAIISGCRAEIILRITANQLDSVLYDDGKSVPKNFRFGDETYSFMQKYSFDSLSYRYYYSDEDDSLAPNQFELHYLITQEPFEQDHYTIELTDFGYYDAGKRSFMPLYTGSWQVDVSFVPASDTSRVVDIGQEITVGDHRFILENLRISPLACSVNLVCEEDAAYVEEHFSEIFEVFSEESRNCVLLLADGTELGDRQFYVEYSNPDEFRFFILFFGPAAVDDIVALSLCGAEFTV